MGLAIRSSFNHFSTSVATNLPIVQGIKKNYPQPKAHKKPPIIIRKFFRFLRCEKNPLIDQIKQLAINHQIIPNNQQKIKKVLEALKSIDYSSLKKDLKQIIAHMTDVERINLLTAAVQNDLKKNQKSMGNQCLQLMTLQQLRELAKYLSPAFITTQAMAQDFNTIEEALKKFDAEEIRKKLINAKEFILFRMLKNFINTLSVAFNLLELGKEPNTYFETKYMLDIYWRLLEIPFQIMKFIFSFFVNPLISLAIIGIGSIVSSVAIHIFKKWKTVPEQLPYCKNFTEEIKKGTIKPVYGRDLDLKIILDALAANNEAGRKHPLLVGKPGIGKTELMKGLAWLLENSDEVPANLKGKKLFYINSAELSKSASGFSLKDPLEQIMHKIDIHRKDLILVFDEAHNLLNNLGDRFNSVLDTTPDSLFYAIGITTPEHYRDKIETTTLDRRFEKICISEPNGEQIRTILRNMNQQQASDIKVSDQILDLIYNETNTKIKRQNQPDKVVLVMSKAFERIRQLQNGGNFADSLNAAMAAKSDLISKLKNQKLNGITISLEPIREIKEKLRELNALIETITRQMSEKKQKAEAYEKLKKQRHWHHEWTKHASKKIAEASSKNKPISELMEKIYLFNNFVLSPLYDKTLLDFPVKNSLETDVTPEIITKIVNDLQEREQILLKNAQPQPQGVPAS